MSRIVFDNNYVIVQPTFREVLPHKHSFYHIFFLSENIQCSEIYVVGSDMLHTMPSRNICKLFLMIDPTSVLAECLSESILSDCRPHKLQCVNVLSVSENMSDEDLKGAVKIWLLENGFDKVNDSIKSADERIIRLVCEIRDYKHLDEKISDIAKQCYLSESRLSHIFKDSMGISLKGYLNIAQMKYAYKLITEGKGITYAAYEAGFGSSAHLAAVCKKQMGISVTAVLK
ncbi:MAG: helix-turn-helix transcriptional regulator [Ruminococcus sp.]|nr:helix-turn-helix transcriptional regulator [Ruminococcus sp.]